MGKIRESGMPSVDQWESYFDPLAILESFGCRDLSGDCVEFGCGYGTFTLAAATHLQGIVYTSDIDHSMVAATRARAIAAACNNVVVEQRDFVVEGCGRPDGRASFVMLFNILHIEDPLTLLREAYRVLRSGGIAGVIHWKHDAGTPRGPPLEIRPRPASCQGWAEQVGFRCKPPRDLPGSTWHWGMVAERP